MGRYNREKYNQEERNTNIVDIFSEGLLTEYSLEVLVNLMNNDIVDAISKLDNGSSVNDLAELIQENPVYFERMKTPFYPEFEGIELDKLVVASKDNYASTLFDGGKIDYDYLRSTNDLFKNILKTKFVWKYDLNDGEHPTVQHKYSYQMTYIPKKAIAEKLAKYNDFSIVKLIHILANQKVTKENYKTTDESMKVVQDFLAEQLEAEMKRNEEKYRKGKMSTVKFNRYKKAYEKAKEKELPKIASNWADKKEERECMFRNKNNKEDMKEVK